MTVACSVVLFGCGGGGGDGSESSDTTSATAAAPGGGGAGDVTIAGFAYEPKQLTVSPGTTVTWTNDDDVVHTVTAADDASATFDSGDLEGGATFEHQFESAGTFPYFCSVHEYMTAEVVVEG